MTTMQLLSFIAKKFDYLLKDTNIEVLFLCDENNALTSAFQEYAPREDLIKFTFTDGGFLRLHRNLYQTLIKSDRSSNRKNYLIHLPYVTKDQLSKSILYQFTILPNTNIWSQDIRYYIREYAESVKNIGRDALDQFLLDLNTRDLSLVKLDEDLNQLQAQSESPYGQELIASIK